MRTTEQHNPGIRLLSGTWAIAVVLAAVAFAVGCSGERTGETAAKRFDNMDAFAQSRDARSKDRRRVVVIGVDAAAWAFLNPHIEDGTLPNFARLKREGAWGKLRSTECYVTPPGWTTMFSGVLPERSGVYTFGTWDPREHRFLNVLADDVEVPRVWDVASHARRRVAVVNVPVTYPPTPVNGLMIAGMMTPNEPVGRIPLIETTSPFTDKVPTDPAIASYSPVQRAASADALNTIIWMVYDTTNDGARNYDRVSMTVVPYDPAATPMEKWPRYTFEIGGLSPWVKIRVRQDGEIINGWCRIGMDAAGKTLATDTFLRIDWPYTYPEELAGELEQQFGYYLPTKYVGADILPYIADDAARQAAWLFERDDWDLYVYVFTQSDNAHHLAGYRPPAPEVYRHIDRTLGIIMDRLGESDVLIVASDHGTDEFDYGIDLNQYFAATGLLEWTEGGDIDWDHTLVFHNLWHLYFNHELLTDQELTKRGIELIPGATPSVSLAHYLTGLGEALTNDDGMPMPVLFSPMPEGAVGDPPDMIVRGSYDGYMVLFWNFRTPQERVVNRLVGGSRWWHGRDGVLLAWGDGIRPNYDIGTTDIQNVAPTILYALGLPVAENLDGKVIESLFEPRSLARLPRYSVPDYAGVVTARTSGTAREDLEKKLKSLGYIQH